MASWKLTCIVIVVFTTIQFASGYKAAQNDKSSKKVLGHVAKISKSKLGANASYEVCDIICDPEGDCTIYYCPGDEICCTPLDPASLCCPADHPLCLPEGVCCPEGYPKLCGEYCCVVDSFCCDGEICCADESACCGGQCCEAGDVCCNGENCCADESACCGEQCCEAGGFCCNGKNCCADESACCGEQCCEAGGFCCNGEKCCADESACCGEQCCEAGGFCCNGEKCCADESACCGEQCCEAGDVCCNGEKCCEDESACCGEQCCPGEASCCKQNGDETCCDKDAMGCCDGYGCVPPCESQFDAIGCQLSNLSLDAKHWKESRPTAPTKLYRILRPDEQPNPGIVAKNPSAQKTVLSHVNCGSRPKYASQYISTSASLDMAKYYKQKGEEKGLTGLRIAEIDVATLPESCTIVDLTTEANRDEYLGNAVCKIFAMKSEEVLLQCDVPIPCKVIDPPPEHVKKIVHSREL